MHSIYVMKDCPVTNVRLTKTTHAALKSLVRELSAELDAEVSLSEAIQYLLDLKTAPVK